MSGEIACDGQRFDKEGSMLDIIEYSCRESEADSDGHRCTYPSVVDRCTGFR
uniref:Uncharacterized protein n=1 Tax=Parascaris equorum TaxID=6256 RepID=A0A914RGH9_PAREQ